MVHRRLPTMDLPMEFWTRTDDCKEAKSRHLEYLDRVYSSREQFIEDTVFTDIRTGEQLHTVLERNMFPYDCPQGVEHFTLWSRDEMTHDEVHAWVTAYLAEHMPHVCKWNYDSNEGDRSILWFHVHVYLQSDPACEHLKQQQQEQCLEASAYSYTSTSRPKRRRQHQSSSSYHRTHHYSSARGKRRERTRTHHVDYAALADYSSSRSSSSYSTSSKRRR